MSDCSNAVEVGVGAAQPDAEPASTQLSCFFSYSQNRSPRKWWGRAANPSNRRRERTVRFFKSSDCWCLLVQDLGGAAELGRARTPRNVQWGGWAITAGGKSKQSHAQVYIVIVIALSFMIMYCLLMGGWFFLVFLFFFHFSELLIFF